MDSARKILLLTATIVPPTGVVTLARIDPAQRFQDYAQALQFYLSCLRQHPELVSGIVFVDNSNSDLSQLIASAREYDLKDRVEFISFAGLDYPPELGRGYGEFKLVDYAMQESRLIQQLSPTDKIWKITGRYTLANLIQLLKTQPEDVDLYCHCRNLPVRWAEMYAISWSRQAYRQTLEGVYTKLTPANGGPVEPLFRDLIDGLQSEKLGLKIVKRLRLVPDLRGYRGFDNQRYEDSQSKMLVRKFIHRFLPMVWI